MENIVSSDTISKELQLTIKKAVLKSWAADLLQMNKINEKRYATMITMIEKIKQQVHKNIDTGSVELKTSTLPKFMSIVICIYLL